MKDKKLEELYRASFIPIFGMAVAMEILGRSRHVPAVWLVGNAIYQGAIVGTLAGLWEYFIF